MVMFTAPCKGRLLSMDEVPSDTFSKRMMGDGFAIELNDYEVVSPVDGVIQGTFPTGHAVMMSTKEGVEVLIHLGIDTYKVGENLFELCIKEGQEIKKGDLLVKVDLDRLKAADACLVSPIVVTSGQKVEVLKLHQELERNEEQIAKVHI